MPAQYGFDFTEFDSVAADFDLVVQASEELEIAVGQITR